MRIDCGWWRFEGSCAAEIRRHSSWTGAVRPLCSEVKPAGRENANREEEVRGRKSIHLCTSFMHRSLYFSRRLMRGKVMHTNRKWDYLYNLFYKGGRRDPSNSSLSPFAPPLFLSAAWQISHRWQRETTSCLLPSQLGELNRSSFEVVLRNIITYPPLSSFCECFATFFFFSFHKQV